MHSFRGFPRIPPDAGICLPVCLASQCSIQATAASFALRGTCPNRPDPPFRNRLRTFSSISHWYVVLDYATRLGFKNLAPHDLRRTCAKLCRAAGGELEQIQLLLGHASVQTTEKYLGTVQNLTDAPNDHIRLHLASSW